MTQFLYVRQVKDELSKLTQPAMQIIKRTMEQTDPPALADRASRWVAEMVVGRPKQRAEIVSAQKVDIRNTDPRPPMDAHWTARSSML